MTPLKHNFCYAVLSDDGQADAGNQRDQGIYYFDCRYLSVYRFAFDHHTLIYQDASPNTELKQYWSRHQHHQQLSQIDRHLILNPNGFSDSLSCHNPTKETQLFAINLAIASDFQDMFEIRGQWLSPLQREISRQRSNSGYQATYLSRDQQRITATIHFSLPLNHADGWKIEVPAGQTMDLRIHARFSSSDSLSAITTLPDYQAFKQRFSAINTCPAISQAIDDVYALLLATPDGLTIAAGVPRFVAPFGRDALICSFFLLSYFPELAKGTLTFLARHQGTHLNAFNDEQPGKILHEYRYGERSRLGDIPFQPYFGASDATALFVILVHDYCSSSHDWQLMKALQPNWHSALQWLENQQHDETGFIGFTAHEDGLTNHCWKDSADSMSHRDGTLAEQPIYVSEIQAYGYRAFCCAGHFFDRLNEVDMAMYYRDKAEQLQHHFDHCFWQPKLGSFALALDGKQQPLAVQNSNAGHCLWSGIVKAERQQRLVQTLFSDSLWSGWGLRTLGNHEVRYHPLSYHNGSVWPHDMAVVALGLKRYGFMQEYQRMADTLMEVAENQSDKHLPELYSGHDRNRYPVLPYHLSCRPQAWAAAALLALQN